MLTSPSSWHNIIIVCNMNMKNIQNYDDTHFIWNSCCSLQEQVSNRLISPFCTEVAVEEMNESFGNSEKVNI